MPLNALTFLMISIGALYALFVIFLMFVIGIILWIIISEKINNYRPERKFDEYNEIEKLKEKLDFAITSAKILLFIIFFVSYSLLLIYLISKIPARLNYFYFPYLQ